MTAPLEGLRVLDLGNYVTGPYAAALLGDMGAEVTKVERSPDGDPFRGWGEHGFSPIFASLNRGKTSLCLKLEEDEAREIVLRLAEQSDVLIQNYRPGTMERLGLSYAEVSARKPDIVYCSISGFGSSGPYADRPGYDTVGQAMSGLLGLLTDLDDPLPMGISLADHVTGLFACYGILAALVKRSIRGAGSHVETSLLQATTAFLAENAARYLDEGEVPTRATRTHLAQAYAFRAGDGLPFVVHLSSPAKFWDGLVATVELPSLRDDERFSTRKQRISNYVELQETLAQRFATQPRAHWLDRLAAHDVPAAPINRLDEVFADPGVRHLDLIHELPRATGRPIRLLRGAVNLLDYTPSVPSAPPLLGEQSRLVLRSAGVPDAVIRSYEESGLVKYTEGLPEPG